MVTEGLLQVLFLAVLECALSVDNAVVLAVMVRHLPEHQRKKALTYGIAGAFAFRLLALAFVATIMKLTWLKMAGGAYLIFIGLRHVFGAIRNALQPGAQVDDEPVSALRGFWATVAMVEVMDIAFSVDSILAAVAVSETVWVVFAGGVLGILAMRFFANRFVHVLDRWPWMAHGAYALVLLIGARLLMKGLVA